MTGQSRGRTQYRVDERVLGGFIEQWGGFKEENLARWRLPNRRYHWRVEHTNRCSYVSETGLSSGKSSGKREESWGTRYWTVKNLPFMLKGAYMLHPEASRKPVNEFFVVVFATFCFGFSKEQETEVTVSQF